MTAPDAALLLPGAGNLHASVVAFGARHGVMLLGPSGSGKSRLALALIGEGAQLVADDQVFLCESGGALYARAPRSTLGLIEARGLGLLQTGARRLARLVLAVDLALPQTRLPEPAKRQFAGVTLACLPGRPDTSFARALRHYLMRRMMRE